MAENFDLIVVGAGPAGSATAFSAAEAGISVLLIEEHPEIGIPLVCAEGLSRSTIKDYLDIKPEWISQELKGAIVRGLDGEEFKVEYPGVGWILDREVFDKALAEMAKAKGAVLKTSSRAIGIEDDQVIVDEKGVKKRYKFKFLIGADGIASRTGKWMGINTKLDPAEIEVCAEYLIDGIKFDAHYAYLIFGEQYAPGGYAWIFPKSNNSANIGLGISPLKLKKKPKYFLDEWVKKEFPQGKIRKRIFGGVPAKLLKKFSGKNFFLVGDAARFTDPLSGAGIANAIKSGVIAGRNTVLRLENKKDYFEAEIKKEILDEIKFHLRVRNVYLKLTDREYNEIFKIAKRIFKGKTIDDINTKHLVREILLSSPRLLWLGFRLLF
jgi:digeranylgeranylglycerophospholipid reductase